MEEQIVQARKGQPTWGPRKIRAHLMSAGVTGLPAASTVSAILRRHEMIDEEVAAQHHAFMRFERAQPNQLWQMDFKGHFALEGGGYCHTLSVIDDHSRFVVGLVACADETFETVQRCLTDIFRTYGQPERILVDNGSPWGDDANTHHTILTTWLMRLGIEVCHGRPYHPQTQGKVERFHRTLKEDLLERHAFITLEQTQSLFDQWRLLYNTVRPHDALELQPPASRYRPSNQAFVDPLPPVTYGPGEQTRKVDDSGKISFRNRRFHVGKAFRHQVVAIRETADAQHFAVHFGEHLITVLEFIKRQS
jgi:transposase InsO family protein